MAFGLMLADEESEEYVKMVKEHRRNPLNHKTEEGRRAYKLYSNKKTQCKSNNIYFDLTISWIEKRIKQGCALTGRPFDLKQNGKRGGNPLGYSIDRIDPKAGYTKDNCRMILFCINAFKFTMTDEQMISIARDIVDNS